MITDTVTRCAFGSSEACWTSVMVVATLLSAVSVRYLSQVVVARVRFLLTAVVIAFAVVSLFGGATGRASQSRTRTCGPAWNGTAPYFAPGSPFNRPILVEAPVDPGSPGMVEGLVAAGAEHRFSLSVNRFTVPVYHVGPNARVRDVQLTASWAPRRVLHTVPIPRGTRPDPASDGHLAIVDRRAGCEYDFWMAKLAPGGGITAAWATTTSLARTGVVTNGPAARASGFALLAGLILPGELRRGSIEHALVFGYPFTRADGPVSPAVGSDGHTEGPSAIPIGARIQLDPQLDLDALELRPYERTVAQALQVYGAYVSDTGGAISFPVAHPQSHRSNPYAGLLPDDTFVTLDRIPLNRMRVLRLPSGARR
jgi:hypothetical protein